MKVDTHKLVVYLPDTRGTTISRFGSGNLKIGLNVFTYSRLPGHTADPALGTLPNGQKWFYGTCPGATEECQAICYAARPVTENGPVFEMWKRNSVTEEVPTELPPGCTLLRLHISGDFTTTEYIDGWTSLIARYPSVRVWAYTRSWRVPELLPALERLRALPNVQLFASMDKSTPELPPAGWRRAWIEGDPRASLPHPYSRDHFLIDREIDDAISYVCPEETGRQPDCESCGYCFKGKRHDVTFLQH